MLRGVRRVSGIRRVSHDQLVRLYLDTDQWQEFGAVIRGRRDSDKFGH